jgi:iron complex transport system substrate-binding protein
MPHPLRIVSLLPAATEMVFALGLGDRLVGRSHECNWPPEARAKPVVVRPACSLDGLGLREIDEAVSQRVRRGASLYQVDEALLRELAPDLILTQNLCQVCAPSGNEVSRVLQSLPHPPTIVWLTPRSLEDIFENVRQIAVATNREARATSLIAAWKARLEQIARATRHRPRPRVFFMEWLDPIYSGGHWVPPMVDLAGGVDALGRPGADSVPVPWSDVRNWAPQILIVSPCGFPLEKVASVAEQLPDLPGWSELPAVRSGRVFAVDADSYFSRPGPRVVDGVALLAHLIHPDIFPASAPADACRQLKTRPSRRGRLLR